MFNAIRVSSLSFTLGAVLLAATAIPQLKAGQFDKKTIMTFSAPVEISGQVLPAGTYVFKTFGDDRDIVAVMNGDENHVLATVLTVPIEANAVSDKVRVEFAERPGNAPEAIRAVFYPGEEYGWEFPESK